MTRALQHRTRIYEQYVSSGQAGTGSGAQADLAPRAAYLRKLVRDHLPRDRNSRILDVGCGGGALLHFCREAGYCRLEGIDVSREQVRNANALGLESVREADLMGFLREAAAASYDTVLAFDVLEHFTREEVMEFLACVSRVLRPGGTFIVHVPNGDSPFVGSVRYGDFTHHLAFTRNSLAPIGRISGFSHIACYEDRPIPHGFVSFARLVLWHAIRAVLVGVTAVETGHFDRQAIYSRNLLAVMVKDAVER